MTDLSEFAAARRPIERESAWPEVAIDLRKVLVRARWPDVDQVLADLRPVFASVERAQGKVESELVWALLVVAADRMRRKALHDRGRPAP